MADAPSSVQQLDGITVILNDHRNVEDFFSKYEQSTDSAEKLRLVSKIIEELTVHAAIEEQVLYPLVSERLEDGDELRSHAVEEHDEAREVLAALEQLPVTDGSFDDKVRELIDEVRHHVEEEEEDLLPKLRDRLSGKELTDLGERLRKAKAGAPVSPSQDERAAGNGTAQGDGEAPGTKEELYKRAQELDIDGRSQMSKDQLAREVDKQG
jgi:hemerythrin superfamily protein